MKLYLSFLFGTAAALQNIVSDSVNRVTNGTDTPQGVAPWAVILYGWGNPNTTYSQCTGAILDSTTILVAAHCINNPETGVITPPKLMTVGYNSVDEGKMQHASVSQTFVHPSFNPETIENDVGFVKLTSPITLTPGYAEALPIYDGPIAPHQEISVHGWGVMDAFSGGNTPSILQQGTVYAGTVADCRATLGRFTNNNDNLICIDYKYSPGVGTCYGDSGGSVTITVKDVPYGAGVVSFNRYLNPAPNQCGVPGDYSFYAHTFYYLSWIENVTGTTFVTGPNGRGAVSLPTPTFAPAPTPTPNKTCFFFFFCF